jgi:hypothetical protein
MPIDELEAKLAEQTWKEKVSSRLVPVPIDLTTQHLGNRVISRFFPEHWAKVQLTRYQEMRYGTQH